MHSAAEHAGVPGEEAGEPEQHRAADDGLVVRRPDAGGAPDDDRPLQRSLVSAGDRPIGEQPEPGGDAVHLLTRREPSLHRSASLVDVLQEGRIDRHVLVLDRHPPVQVEVELVVTPQDDHSSDRTGST